MPDVRSRRTLNYMLGVFFVFQIATIVYIFKSPREEREIPRQSNGFGKFSPPRSSCTIARKTIPLSSLSDTYRGNLLLRWRELLVLHAPIPDGQVPQIALYHFPRQFVFFPPPSKETGGGLRGEKLDLPAEIPRGSRPGPYYAFSLCVSNSSSSLRGTW